MEKSMMYSIMDLVTPEMTSALGTRLGASATAVQTGLGTGVATILAAIADKSGNSELMGRVYNAIQGADSHAILDGLSNLASGGAGSGPAVERGSRLMSLLFGMQKQSVENLIARQSGASPSAGSGIMEMAAPLAVGCLGQQIQERGLNASTFADLMGTEAAKLKSFVPAGISGIFSGGGGGGHEAHNPGPQSNGASSGPGFNLGKPTLLLVGLLAIGLIAWLLSRHCCTAPEVSNKVAEMGAPAAGVGAL